MTRTKGRRAEGVLGVGIREQLGGEVGEKTMTIDAVELLGQVRSYIDAARVRIAGGEGLPSDRPDAVAPSRGAGTEIGTGARGEDDAVDARSVPASPYRHAKVVQLEGEQLRVPTEVPAIASNMVLKHNTAVELGTSNLDSANVMALTRDPSSVVDGRVTVIGADIDQVIVGTTVPFVQVLIAAGEGLDAHDVQVIDDCRRARSFLKGYMVRATEDAIWCRVSNDLYEEGVGFALVASAVRGMVMARVPAVTAVEMAFVVGDLTAVRDAAPLLEAARAFAHAARKSAAAEAGIDIDCPWGGHCGDCALKDTCDEVRNIERLRRQLDEAGL